MYSSIVCEKPKTEKAKKSINNKSGLYLFYRIPYNNNNESTTAIYNIKES